MTVHTLLCPVDFSDASRHAIDYAVAIAGWFRARIVALHVIEPIGVMMPAMANPIVSAADDEDDLTRLTREVLAGFDGAVEAGISVDIAIDLGSPVTRILDRAADHRADLIVMGTHGTSGFERFVLGSVTEKVLHRSSCPVLTVPPRVQTASRLPFRQLLCAVDFSDASLVGLACARSLARESNAALTVVYVLEWPWDEPPAPRLEELPAEQAFALSEYRRYCETTALARLESVVDAGDHGGQRPTVRLRSGKPYVQLLQVADEIHSDLIVMGVHGRSAIDLTVLGSTATQVVRRAECPVLTLRG